MISSSFVPGHSLLMAEELSHLSQVIISRNIYTFFLLTCIGGMPFKNSDLNGKEFSFGNEGNYIVGIQMRSAVVLFERYEGRFLLIAEK